MHSACKQAAAEYAVTQAAFSSPSTAPFSARLKSTAPLFDVLFVSQNFGAGVVSTQNFHDVLVAQQMYNITFNILDRGFNSIDMVGLSRSDRDLMTTLLRSCNGRTKRKMAGCRD